MGMTNLKVLLVALLVVGFYTMVARSIPQLESAVPEEITLSDDVTPEDLIAIGERVYNGAGGCVSCHGLGQRAPNLLSDHAGEGPIGARCGGRREGVDCKAYLYQSLTDPGAVVIEGFDNIMPDMRRSLPEIQIWAVVAYLQVQGGDVTVTAADLPDEAPGAEAEREGDGTVVRTATIDPRQLLQENACLGCHALDGAGPPVGPPFDGMGARIGADRIRRGILEPAAEVASGYESSAGVMPDQFGNQLSGAQLESIVQFLAARR